MASIKISELNELEKASKQDLLVIVDVANNETKKIQAKNFAGGTGTWIGEDEPPADENYNMWVDPTEPLNNVGSEVVDSLKGNETDKAPSVRAVNEVNTYSTKEQVIGTWANGKPLYRRLISYDYNKNHVSEQTLDVFQIPNNYSIRNIDGLVEVYNSETNTEYQRWKLNSDNGARTIYYSCYQSANRTLRVKAKQDVAEAAKLHIVIIIEYTKNND